MKNEDKIVELLAESLSKQDVFINELKGMKVELQDMKKVQIRQENHLVKMLEILADDVPKFDELLDIEYFGNKNQIILKKHR